MVSQRCCHTFLQGKLSGSRGFKQKRDIKFPPIKEVLVHIFKWMVIIIIKLSLSFYYIADM